MTQLEEIHLHFGRNHIKLRMEWLREVVNFLSNVKVVLLINFFYNLLFKKITGKLLGNPGE